MKLNGKASPPGLPIEGSILQRTGGARAVHPPAEEKMRAAGEARFFLT